MTPRRPKVRPNIPGLVRARREAEERKFDEYLALQRAQLEASLTRMVASAEQLADHVPGESPPVVWIQ